MKRILGKIFKKSTTTKTYLFYTTLLFMLLEISCIGLMLISVYGARNWHNVMYISQAMTKIFQGYIVAFGAYMARAFLDTVSEKGSKIKLLNRESKRIKNEINGSSEDEESDEEMEEE